MQADVEIEKKTSQLNQVMKTAVVEAQVTKATSSNQLGVCLYIFKLYMYIW